MKNIRLIELREKAGLTQTELGNIVGLSQSMIAHIEAGRKDPSKQYKIELARYFKVTVDWLFYEQINDQESYSSKHTQPA